MAPDFVLDPRLAADTHPAGDLAMCSVLLMNDARFPWVILVPQVEAALHGRPATAETFEAAAALAGEGATPTKDNAFKVKLVQRAVLRGLQLAAA